MPRNIFAFGLFVSPIQTFRRITRTGSTEQFSRLPYIYALLSCLISSWYGTPLVMVMTVNSIGAVFQFVYIILFIVYTGKGKKIRMLGLLATVLCLVGIIVFLSLRVFDSETRRIFVGFLSCASMISMFASPLFIVNLVIRTRSVEYMPFYLSVSTFLMSLSVFVYGILNEDPFVYAPSGIGFILGIIQLGLYAYYNKSSYDQD
ncbi:Bidirectional sugar transporter SWEET2-like protein [Drosera capensis]